MSKQVRIHIAALVCLFALMAVNAKGQSHWVGINTNSPVKASIEHLETTSESITMKFSVDGYLQQPVRTPRGTENIISLEKGVQVNEKGMPDLPKLFASVVIPDLYNTDVKVISSKYYELDNIVIAPSKGNFTRDTRPEDVSFTYGEAYQTHAFWPGILTSADDPFIMRDFRGQTISVYPLQYNPVSKVLRVYTDLTVQINSIKEPGKNELERKKSIVEVEREFGYIYDRFFINMPAASKSYSLLEGDEGSLLIIAYDDYLESMQPFVDWKRTAGRKTDIVPVSVAGQSASEIQSFVKAWYEENTGFAHLLLVGDAHQVPVVTTQYGHSDNAYGFLLGNNSYNDIFVGRFSAESVSDVKTQVERVIHYERDINESDTWLSVALGMARNEGTGTGHNGGENDYKHMNFIRDTLLNYTYTDVLQRYDGDVPGIQNTSATMVSADINAGLGLINFCNHGSSGGWSVANFKINNVDELTNVNKLPFIWSVACQNGDFVADDCFAEAWMRATHNGKPAGAIATMMSTIVQPWQAPMTGQDEMITLLAEKSITSHKTLQRTFGGLSINGSMAMIPAHGKSGIETHHTWVLFGDPTLKVRTAAPEPFLVQYNPVVFTMQESFEVTVIDGDGAMVAITYRDPETQEVVIAGSSMVKNGVASIVFAQPFTEPATATLAITGFNKVTYLNTELKVIYPDGPYVIFDAFEIDDSFGNQNLQADYNEFVKLNISLKNVGNSKAEQVTAVISTDSEYITLVDKEHSWGEIGQHRNTFSKSAFSFKVAENVPDNQPVKFNLAIRSIDHEGKTNEWRSDFSLRVFSPDFTIAGLHINDSAYGNTNGRLDPGESAQIVVTYVNTGGAPAMSPVSRIHLSSPYIVIDDKEVRPGIVMPGDSVEVSFGVNVNPSARQGTIVQFSTQVEDARLFETESFLLVGEMPEKLLGKERIPSNQFPFYNFYLSNRSQMIYTREELGGVGKTIAGLGFEILVASSRNNRLPGFRIRMKHVSQSTLNSFENMTGSKVVYTSDLYQMPSEPGWHFWETEPFEYDGISNLLIEITWGMLENWSPDYFRVASSNTVVNRTAYGFSDTRPVPEYYGATSIRPNIQLNFITPGDVEDQLVELVIKNQLDQTPAEATLNVGSLKITAESDGKSRLMLQPGTYPLSASAPGHKGFSGQELHVLHPSMHGGTLQSVDVLLTRLFSARFAITDVYGNPIDDARIILDDISTQPGVYDFMDLMPGVYPYIISRDFYFASDGIIELYDEDVLVNVMLQPDGTPIDEVPAELVMIYPNPFSDQLYLDAGTGQTSDIQIYDIPGKMVLTIRGVSGLQSLDLSYLPAGNYIVKLVNSSGTNVFRVSKIR